MHVISLLSPSAPPDAVSQVSTRARFLSPISALISLRYLRSDPPLCPPLCLLRVLTPSTASLCSSVALHQAGTKLLKLMGYQCGSVLPMIGLEQEFFLVPQVATRRGSNPRSGPPTRRD